MPRARKHPDQMTGHSKGRAGHAADVRSNLTTVVREPVKQPPLTKLLGRYNPMLTGKTCDGCREQQDAEWSPYTIALWEALRGFPTTQNLQLAQWMILARAVALDDASLHDPKLANEARIRLSQFGVTPDDLLKMRITVVAADEAERRGTTRPKAEEREPASKRLGPHLRVAK